MFYHRNNTRMKFVRQYYPDNNRDPLKTRESNVDPLRCGTPSDAARVSA